LLQRYLNGQAPALLTFGVVGGFEGGRRFLDALRMFKRLVNMGDAKSLATHPASTTHRQLTPDQLARAGITPETVRLAIGIEHIDDILADLDQALSVSMGAGRPALAYRTG
jgi:O-acetylhomoserine (thiol)-lyase